MIYKLQVESPGQWGKPENWNNIFKVLTGNKLPTHILRTTVFQAQRQKKFSFLQTKVEIITKRLLLDLDHKEGWVLKNWCFWTVVLEKTLQSLLDSKEIKPVNLKEINPEYSLEGLRLKLKLQFWPPDVKSQLIWKRPWCWKRLKTGGKGDDRGWDGWMASTTQHSWIWANSRRRWRRGKPGVL